MFQHSWCRPEEQVHPAGDQDLTDKDLVNTAETGVVQQPLHCPCAHSDVTSLVLWGFAHHHMLRTGLIKAWDLK